MKNHMSFIFLILIVLACSENKSVVILGKNCNSNLSFSEHDISQINHMSQVGMTGPKGNSRKISRIRHFGDLHVDNDIKNNDHPIELTVKTTGLKGIHGQFQVLRKVGNTDYKVIDTSSYGYDDVADAEINKNNNFVWREQDHHRMMANEVSGNLPVNTNQDRHNMRRHARYRVIFQPDDAKQKKHRKTLFYSTEVSAHPLPKTVDHALADILDDLKYAYSKDCGFFETVIADTVTKRDGIHAGNYERYTNDKGNITYRFENYSHDDDLKVTGELDTQSVRYNSLSGQNYLIPRKVNGILHISGLYDATLSFINVDFADNCGKNIESGFLKLNYKHPKLGMMSRKFTQVSIPDNLLS